MFNCRPVGSKDCAQGVAVPETRPEAGQAGAHQQEHPSAADGQWEAGNEGGNWCQAHQVKKYSFFLFLSFSSFLFIRINIYGSLKVFISIEIVSESGNDNGEMEKESKNRAVSCLKFRRSQ